MTLHKEKINTIIICPECKTEIDVKHIKQAVKNRLDQEMDYILDSI